MQQSRIFSQRQDLFFLLIPIIILHFIDELYQNINFQSSIQKQKRYDYIYSFILYPPPQPMKKPYIIITIFLFIWLCFLVSIYIMAWRVESIQSEYNDIIDKYDIHRIEQVRILNQEILTTKARIEELRTERDWLIQEIDTPPADILDPQLHFSEQ